jgi:hypothetical protein
MDTFSWNHCRLRAGSAQRTFFICEEAQSLDALAQWADQKWKISRATMGFTNSTEK